MDSVINGMRNEIEAILFLDNTGIYSLVYYYCFFYYYYYYYYCYYYCYYLLLLPAFSLWLGPRNDGTVPPSSPSLLQLHPIAQYRNEVKRSEAWKEGLKRKRKKKTWKHNTYLIKTEIFNPDH